MRKAIDLTCKWGLFVGMILLSIAILKAAGVPDRVFFIGIGASFFVLAIVWGSCLIIGTKSKEQVFYLIRKDTEEG